MSMRLLRGKMYEALMCNRRALEIQSESVEDVENVENLSLLRSFLELEETNLRSIMIRSSTRPVPRIFVNYESSSSWPSFWDGLASFVWSARSERCHFIEWTLRSARECVLRDRDFESARLFVRPFRPLRGLLLLLCADSFKDDIVSLQRLVDTIWSEKDTRVEEEEKNERVEKSSSSQPRVERYCDQLEFRLRFTWWFAQRYKESRLFNSNDEEDKNGTQNRSGSLSPEHQERQSRTRRIANRVLSELSERSFLFVMRESLHNIDEVELLRFLVDRPVGNPEDVSEHERDLIVLRGYYAFRHAFRVCYSEAKIISDDENLLLPGSRDMIVTNALKPVRVHLLNVPTVWRLPLLEGLFSLLFLKSSDLREEKFSSDTKVADEDNDNSERRSRMNRKIPQFIVTAALIRGLLKILEDCLEHDVAKNDILKRRAKRLRKHVEEARERMETLVDTEKHWRRSPSELMGRMLASPLSLLHVCLKQRKYVVFLYSKVFVYDSSLAPTGVARSSSTRPYHKNSIFKQYIRTQIRTW